MISIEAPVGDTNLAYDVRAHCTVFTGRKYWIVTGFEYYSYIINDRVRILINLKRLHPASCNWPNN